MIDANANAGLQPKNSYGATVYKIYDELNRVKSETDALNGVTSYSYDLLGNVTSITDANGHTTYFDYNDMGRLTTVRDPRYPSTGKATTFTYYETGEVLTRTKRSGATATYTLDALNRLEPRHSGGLLLHRREHHRDRRLRYLRRQVHSKGVGQLPEELVPILLFFG